MGITQMTERRSRSELMALGAGALALWLCSFVFSGAFVAGGLRGSSRAVQVLVHAPSYYDTPGFVYEKNSRAQADLEFFNNVGYFPDGTAYNLAGNSVNHPEEIGPDPHTVGSALPSPLNGYVNDIGYTPDGTDMTKAGNLSIQ